MAAPFIDELESVIEFQAQIITDLERELDAVTARAELAEGTVKEVASQRDSLKEQLEDLVGSDGPEWWGERQAFQQSGLLASVWQQTAPHRLLPNQQPPQSSGQQLYQALVQESSREAQVPTVWTQGGPHSQQQS